MEPLNSSFTRRETVVKVVGVGGGGSNAIDRMAREGLDGVELIAMNTDVRCLDKSLALIKVPLGPKTTRGHGSGGDPAVGRAAATESREEIKRILDGADMVFVTAGMGGGTGTGGAAVVASAAMEVGALTVGIVTTPFGFEGARRMRIARQGLQELGQNSDTHIVVPNQRLLQMLPKNVTFLDAFFKADEVLHQGVRGVTTLVANSGDINVDFNDIRAIMASGGMAIMSIGSAEGEARAVEAAQMAIQHPLLERGIDGAGRVLFHLRGGEDMSLHETDAASEVISERVAESANRIWGFSVDPGMNGTIEITLIATGFAPEGEELVAAAEPVPGRGREAFDPRRFGIDRRIPSRKR